MSPRAEKPAEPLRRFWGKYRGVVSAVDDPEKLGRVRVKVPEVLGDVESGWALPCLPLAGPSTGLFAVPPARAAVWVEFEAGDPGRPIYTGGYWSSDQPPLAPGQSEPSPQVRTLRSEEGLTIALEDSGKKIHVSDADGANLVLIEVDAGKVTVKASSKVVIEAPAIELVDGASHKAVFGDELKSYLSQLASTFNGHTHPGQQAGPYPVVPQPPQPSAQSPQDSMLSTKVKVG